MVKVLLQEMLDAKRFEDLPLNWNSFDLERFSSSKTLWDYQQEGVKNALKCLWKYYKGFEEYHAHENLIINDERKRKFFRWYKDNSLSDDLSIGIDKAKRQIRNLLVNYYSPENGSIPYNNFINRMCFWMATGSGKTLIIIKLIQILRDLVKMGEIPANDILVLTHRDDLIEQFKRHVNEFNASRNDLYIDIRELKEYPERKRGTDSLFRERELTIFYYRSDNLSDDKKEKIINFRDYANHGQWYVFLDEAHKGDKEDSKRQHIYSILSRNGFLFNFSATFTDPRDIITTAFNFNLSEFIRKGYGKHISLLKQEIRAFRDEEDYNNEEKQKIVLKSLIVLTYIKRYHLELNKVDTRLYHKPLMLTLVNSVNIEDADLKLFFRELERIGKGEIAPDVWQSAKNELWTELKDRPKFMFENEEIVFDEAVFTNLKQKDVIELVYNSTAFGEIEVYIRPSNRQEIAFKLKTSDKPFALIKIGDISGWLKNELAGYEINTQFSDEGYFANLNRDDSTVNILMGSRGFYEGWDSNRPNVTNFINIGTATDAKKFILQSIGRGVRIEPKTNIRKRLIKAHNFGDIDDGLFQRIKDIVLPLETLFIFGTNRKALETVIQELRKEAGEDESIISLERNKAADDHKLLIPTYKSAESTFIDKKVKHFEINKDNLTLLKKYYDYFDDKRVFLAFYESDPKKLNLLNRILANSTDYFRPTDRIFKNLDLLVSKLFNYFSVIPEEFKALKELEEEIRHFKQIRVFLKDINGLQAKIEKVKSFKEYKATRDELEKLFREGKITFDELEKRIRSAGRFETFEANHKKIQIKYIANHYYIPIILTDDEKVDFISHIVKTPSEVKFISALEDYLATPNNRFKEFDWWLFSKIDETLDDVYIPYYNPNENRISRFFPDFVFWLQKGDEYTILFVDPKGTEHTSAERKIDGYKEIFTPDNIEKTLSFNGFKVNVKLLFRTTEIRYSSEEYKKFWFTGIEDLF